ncbi:MAG: sensor histidine kinase [Lachnospiraceae bacterium]|nr:sensor histidine kinase [Lachnospiraceae bacterium]
MNKKPSQKIVFSIPSIFLFLFFPISQVILFFLLSQEFSALYQIPIPTFYTFIAVLLIIFIIISFYLYRQYKSVKTTHEFQELKIIHQYQKEQYNVILQQREKLEAIKNTFQLQMEQIITLLDNDNSTESLLQITKLTKEIESTKEYPFCPNPIINAILYDKQSECHEYHISFQINLQIGDCATIDKIHLCSIFSNLLDNSIEACKHITAPEERYIHLSALQSGNYLHIKTKNPATTLVPSKQGHGYGHKILRDIALKYNGEFKTDYDKHIYEAYITIQMP